MGMLNELDQVGREYGSGDRNYLELLLGSTAAAGRKVGDIAATIGDYMVPDALGVGEAVGKGVQYVADSPVGQRYFGMKENFNEAYPRTGRAIGEAVDSVDLMGLAALRRGLFQTDPSVRGLHEASGDVIVPNFYNPREVEYSPRTEAVLQRFFPDEKSESGKEVYVKDNKKQNAIRKTMGFGGWAVAGLKRTAENLVNPYQRATYTEFGISPSYTKAYNEFMEVNKKYKAGEASIIERNQALDVAHSQMQQLANIRAQANAKARGSEASDPFMIAATDPNSPNFFQPKDFGDNWYAQTGAKGANIEQIPEADAKVFQDHVEKVWLGGKTDDVKIVVKKPTGVGGNHFKDVVAQNKYFKHALKVFEVGQKKRGGVEFESVADLEKALKAQSERLVKTQGAKEKSKFFSVVKSDDTGVWITGSRAGSAKVEGGINMLMKVEPNGNITGYMSDLHDFLDKVPGVKNVLEYTLPTKVLAVSPPMQSNIYSVMAESSTASKYGPEGVSKRVPYPSAAGEQAKAVERIEASGKLQPSRGEVARQTGQIAQNVAAGGMLLGGYDTPVNPMTANQPAELPENYSRY